MGMKSPWEPLPACLIPHSEAGGCRDGQHTYGTFQPRGRPLCLQTLLLPPASSPTVALHFLGFSIPFLLKITSPPLSWGGAVTLASSQRQPFCPMRTRRDKVQDAGGQCPPDCGPAAGLAVSFFLTPVAALPLHSLCCSCSRGCQWPCAESRGPFSHLPLRLCSIRPVSSLPASQALLWLLLPLCSF